MSDSNQMQPLNGQTGNANGAIGLDEAAVRERCSLLGIDWLEDAPEASSEAVACITPETAVRLRVVPLRFEHNRLVIAMLDPLDIAAADEVTALTGRAVSRLGLEKDAFSELMRAHYGTTAARMAESLAGEADDIASDLEHNLDAIEADDIHRMAEQPTLINLVNLLLLEAIQQRTSDVHIEPFEDVLKVKYRVDGVLAEQKPAAKALATSAHRPHQDHGLDEYRGALRTAGRPHHLAL